MYKKWSLSFDLNKIVSSFYYKTTLHYRETKTITSLQILLVSILFYKTRKRVDSKNKTRQEVSAKIHDNGKSTLLMFLIWIWITSSSVLSITTDIFHWQSPSSDEQFIPEPSVHHLSGPSRCGRPWGRRSPEKEPEQLLSLNIQKDLQTKCQFIYSLLLAEEVQLA